MPIKKDSMTNSIKRMAKRLDKEPAPAAYKFFKGITPIDTGRARRSTKLRGKTIHGKYNYASYLDNGWSKQAPTGMSEPTTNFLNKLVAKIMRK